ncbi:MAG: fasciclin domain-containing protein [Tunicatimonas sp.]
MKQYFLFSLLLPIVLLFTACGDDDEVSGPPIGDRTVVELVAETEGLSVLNTIISSQGFTGLRNQLSSGEYTLLAPNDAAFQNLLATVGLTELGLLDQGVLSDILSYHVVPNQTLQVGQLDSSVVALSQQPLTFTTTDSVRINASVAVQPRTVIVSPEALFASNGVVHVIDKVLLPPSIQDVAGDFGTVAGLMNVLTSVGLMNSVLEGGGLKNILATETRSFTVIAPTGNFLIENEIGFNEQGFRFFGANHIIESVIDIANPPRKVNNLVGVPLYISPVNENVLLINGVPVATSGGQASNGQVLLSGPLLGENVGDGIIEAPTDVAGGLGAITEATGQSFSIFQAALAQTGLELTGEKTIFVPTDSAFIRAGLTASVDSASRIDNALLTSILNNHVVEGVSFGLNLSPGEVPTLGGSFTVAINNGVVTLSDANAESADASLVFFDSYVYLDIPDEGAITEVGVIHAIDELLLPE